MKRVLKNRTILAIAVMLLIANGIMAQTHNGTAVPGAAGNYVSGAVQTSTYITEGTTVPVYALPDPYYHPAYNVGTSTWTLTDGFIWTWSVGSTLTFSQNNVQDNYVEITAPAASAVGSPYTVNVKEKAPAAYGGCSDAGTNLTINVVAIPDVTIGGSTTYNFCAGDPGLPANIQSTITGGWQNYRLVWSLEIATLNSSAVKAFYYDDENGTLPTVAPKFARNYTTAVPQAIANAAAAPNLMTVGSFKVIASATTVYTYTLTSINDQASRFGNYIALGGDASVPANFTYYAAGPEVVVVTVYPAPVTGPIFHITNTWAN